jgi:membrane-bound lytic murein transglycosylase B
MLRKPVQRFALGLTLAMLAAGPATADVAFNRWVSDFWPAARAAGISAETYNRAFAGVAPDPEVIEKAQYQPEFVKPMAQYVSNAVSDKRLENGRRKLAEHRGLLDAIERTYGVDRHVVVAIWGMESSYGEVLGNPKIVRNVIRSLATLAYADRRRARFARRQLVASLKILQRGDISVRNMTGSWAGAMGHTQFIPTTFEAYAVDFDGDGRRNVWSEVDALASTASYLKKAGWRSGKTWGYEVELPRGFDYRLADSDDARTLAEWSRYGITRIGGKAFPRPDDKAILVLPTGARGPAFLMLRNHYVIKRYNNATAYALAVGHLADRLRGGGGFSTYWPPDERSLAEKERLELQQRLARRGFYNGAIDGKIGPKSRMAIREFQSRSGMVPDGFAGSSLLTLLRQGSS